MRLATILPRASVEPVAVAAAPDGRWVELAGLTGRTVPRLEDSLSWMFAHTAHLAERAATWRGPRYQESEFVFQPPVARPAALRDFDAFEDHVKTSRARRGLAMPAAWYEMPVFHFANHQALVGHEASVWAPLGSHELDFGLALGVVIGRGGRDIPECSAWEHVAGLTIVNDLAARDLELRELPVGLGPAKGRDFATAVGPWLVARDAWPTASSANVARSPWWRASTAANWCVARRPRSTIRSRGSSRTPRATSSFSRAICFALARWAGAAFWSWARRTPAAGSSPATWWSWRSSASAFCAPGSSPGRPEGSSCASISPNLSRVTLTPG